MKDISVIIQVVVILAVTGLIVVLVNHLSSVYMPHCHNLKLPEPLVPVYYRVVL